MLHLTKKTNTFCLEVFIDKRYCYPDSHKSTKSVVDTGGLFAADVADTGGQLPAGVNSGGAHEAAA